MNMPKYLIEANYLGEGVNGLLRDGGSKRRAVVDDLFQSMGGKLEAFYFSFGDRDLYVIGELPDNASAAALAMRVNSAGKVSVKTRVLLTPEEIDTAAKMNITVRPPGS
jgi:uncharacterized protein with GYD domain